MAEPRVFLSSTFYDLRHVRSDLDRFVREMGYVPIRSDEGDVPYGAELSLEEYCYREIERCDIMVSVIGGRYGSESRLLHEYSISQVELKTALRLRKQVYIFVDKKVYAEFEIFRAWGEDASQGFRPHHADDVRVHQFIREISVLPNNNPIFEFESATDVIQICQRQWAGLFQGLLEQQSRRPEEDLLSQLGNTLTVTRQLVEYLTQERKEGSAAIKDILLSNHPAFAEIRRVLDIRFRVFFTTVEELSALLRERQYTEVREIEWENKDRMEWIWQNGPDKNILKVSRSLFDDDGRLIVLSPQEWKAVYISLDVRRGGERVSGP